MAIVTHMTPDDAELARRDAEARERSRAAAAGTFLVEVTPEGDSVAHSLGGPGVPVPADLAADLEAESAERRARRGDSTEAGGS